VANQSLFREDTQDPRQPHSKDHPRFQDPRQPQALREIQSAPEQPLLPGAVYRYLKALYPPPSNTPPSPHQDIHMKYRWLILAIFLQLTQLVHQHQKKKKKRKDLPPDPDLDPYPDP
jgi:hypothetical protein